MACKHMACGGSVKTYDSRTSHPPRLTPRTFVLPQLKATPLLLCALFDVSKMWRFVSRRDIPGWCSVDEIDRGSQEGRQGGS